MSENKAKYAIVNGDEVIGIIYFSEKYGRTIVFTRGVNIEEPVKIYDFFLSQNVVDIDFVSFIQSMLPTS